MKFSIVTPTYNSERTIRETIESVLSQTGNFEIEYFIMDGGSTDNTVNIAREYLPKLKIFSQKDNGMYDAINKGFSMASGDIYAWINSDDTYLPSAFNAISRTFNKYPEIKWLKGKTVFVNENGRKKAASPAYIYNRKWIKKGIYGRNAYFIHQDSVFWKAALWNKAGPIDPKLRLAGDYYLWTAFASYTELWSLDLEVSTFRSSEGQLSRAQESSYRNEQKSISKGRDVISKIVNVFFFLNNKLGNSNNFFVMLYPMLFWTRKKHYIRYKNNEPVIDLAKSFKI